MANIASSPTGMLIPPSNLMIVYSTIAGSVSVAALFMAGCLPGILLEPAQMTGIITPPVDSILFTGCKVGRVKIEQVIRRLLPYFTAILAVLLLVAYVPVVSMALPI